MKKVLLLAPMGSVHRRFNSANIDALQSLGYEIHLLANFDDGEGSEKQNGEFVSKCAERGLTTHSIPYQRHSLKGNLPLVGETAKFIRDGGYSLVHAHTETGGLILRMAGRIDRKAKYLYTPHGMSFYRGSSLKSQLIYRPVERWICSGMDTNIAINQEEYDVLKKWHSASAVFVHGIGVDLDRIRKFCRERQDIRKELGIPADATVILSIGELDENKNHRIVIESLAELKRPDVYYVICGIGPLQEHLNKLTLALGLEGKVIFAGYRKDIPDMIHASDFFAFPSYHEGLPVSLMEAMAGGLPTICSAIRGNVDLIKDNVSGFLVSPNDKIQWKSKISSMLSDKLLCEFFSHKVIEKIKFYSLTDVKNELCTLYGSL